MPGESQVEAAPSTARGLRFAGTGAAVFAGPDMVVLGVTGTAVLGLAFTGTGAGGTTLRFLPARNGPVVRRLYSRGMRGRPSRFSRSNSSAGMIGRVPM